MNKVSKVPEKTILGSVYVNTNMHEDCYIALWESEDVGCLSVCE